MKPISILLVDDHNVVRQGLRILLEAEVDFTVLGEAATGRAAIKMAKKLRPSVVLMDVAIPSLNGSAATREVRKVSPESKVLMLSAYNDDAYVEQAIEAGASGYLLKQSSANMLCRAIRDVQKGKTVFSPSIAKRMSARKLEDSAGLLKKIRTLTPREQEVLQSIAEGNPNKETAAELSISIKTVEKHRDNLMKKLGIHHTAGLTRYAISSGTVERSSQVTGI